VLLGPLRHRADTALLTELRTYNHTQDERPFEVLATRMAQWGIAARAASTVLYVAWSIGYFLYVWSRRRTINRWTVTLKEPCTARALLLDAITNALAHVTGTDAHGSFRHWCYMFHGVPDQ
jgi:hypothetical protein